jgi:hypothetical protein
MFFVNHGNFLVLFGVKVYLIIALLPLFETNNWLGIQVGLSIVGE